MSVGNVAWFSIVGMLPVNVAGLSSIMVPMVAMVSGALVHGEPLGLTQWAAMVCCAVSLSLVLLKPSATKMLCRTTRSTPVELERDFQTSVAKENGNDDDPDSPARQGYGDPGRAVHELRARRQVLETDDE
jgi:hypothetical protein